MTPLEKAKELQRKLIDLQRSSQRQNELRLITEKINGLPAPKVEVNIEKPTRWYFTIERDGSGKISKVIASSEDRYGKD